MKLFKNTHIDIGISGSVQSKWLDPVRAHAAFFEYIDIVVRNDQRLIPSPIRIHAGESDKFGVDIWAKDYAETRKYDFVPHPPDFKRYGRPKAYYVRNKEIARSIGWLYAFVAPSEPTNLKARTGTMMTVRETIKAERSVFVHTLVDNRFKLVWKKLSWFEGWEKHIKGEDSQSIGGL